MNIISKYIGPSLDRSQFNLLFCRYANVYGLNNKNNSRMSYYYKYLPNLDKNKRNI